MTGGRFQSGDRSTKYSDFSFRTVNNIDNRWRIQLWEDDIDVTLVITAAVIGSAVSVMFLFRTSESPKQDTAHDSDIVAKVGNRTIGTAQFRREMMRRADFTPGSIDKNRVLEEMIVYETLLHKAFEAGLDKDEELVRSFHAAIVGRFKSLNLQTLIDKAEVSEAEMREYYEKNQSVYTRPAQIHLSMIFMEMNLYMREEKKSEIRARMAQAKEQALGQKDVQGFSTLAAEFSGDQASRYRGGDIGWVEQGRDYRWEPELLAAGFALKAAGDISDIIETRKGIYLLRLMERKESSVIAFDQAKDTIHRKLLVEKRRRIEKEFMAQMKSGIQVETFPEVLEKIPIPDNARPVPHHLPQN